MCRITKNSLFFIISSALFGLLSACGGDHTPTLPKITTPVAGAPSNSVQQFPNSRDAYTIKKNSGGYIVTEVGGSGSTVQVSAQTTLQFSNVSVNLLMSEKAQQILPKDLSSIIELYIAFFNRVPDADGLCYWIDRFNSGMSLDQMSENFFQAALLFSKETGYTAAMTNTEFVKIIYKNVLGREGALAPPDQDVAYWVDELSSGRSSKGRLISVMLNSAHTFSGDVTWGWVPRFLDNKIAAATLFGVEQGLNYLTPEESISKGMTIIRAITNSSTSEAIKLIPTADTAFNLRGEVPVESTLMGGAIQRNALNLTNRTSTFIGTVPWADGNFETARFSVPRGLVTDGTNLYVADGGNDTVRKINLATGLVSTLAGFAHPSLSYGFTSYKSPNSLVLRADDLFVASANTIQKVSISTGQISVLAGLDLYGTVSKFSALASISSDNTNLYAADKQNHTIWQISMTTGAVTALAGTTNRTGNTDGIGIAASFNTPSGICSDGTHLYVADTGNHSIRKIVIATGRVSTLAGSSENIGTTDGYGQNASFSDPDTITCHSGKVFVSDKRRDNIRQIDPGSAKVSTLAGTGIEGHTDGLAASFVNVGGLASDGTSLYVADTDNRIIRKISLKNGETSTLVGKSPYADGIGAAASITSAEGMTTDGTNLYVADFFNDHIKKISIATGATTVFVGSKSKGDTYMYGSKLSLPSKLTTDGKNLFVLNGHSIKKISIATGEISTLAGSSTKGSNDGIGISAAFNYPKGVTTDGSNLYIADTDNYTIRKIEIATGRVTTLAGKPGTYGGADGVGDKASFSFPSSLTTDGRNLYVLSSKRVRKIVIATGEVTTIAGGGVPPLSYYEGIGNGVNLGRVNDLSCDGKNLYLTSENKVLRMNLETARISIVAGWGSLSYLRYKDGVGKDAAFSTTTGITTDGRSLFVADSQNHLIRKID